MAQKSSLQGECDQWQETSPAIGRRFLMNTHFGSFYENDLVIFRLRSLNTLMSTDNQNSLCFFFDAAALSEVKNDKYYV